MAQLFAGTSGWAYAAWKARFYPEKIKADEMLPFYAQHFNTVEINNSFYRLPAPGAVSKWQAVVPETFRFALKAPRQITHIRRFMDAEGPALRLVELIQRFERQRGPLLLQVPDDQAIDLDRLAGFLDFMRPYKLDQAVEFRHPSWLVEDSYELLRRYDVAMCLTETEESCQPLVSSSRFAYLRLRKAEYSAGDLRSWRSQIDELVASGRDVYCYFMHEDEARGPAYARQLLES